MTALVIIAKIWKPPNVYQQMNGLENVVYIYKTIGLSLEKEGNSIIFDNVDGPKRHYAK